MNNLGIWITFVVVSIFFGIFSRVAIYKNKSVFFWFFEVWRDFVCYFITCVIGYFFVAIRWPSIAQSGNLSVGDFILSLAFLMGALGWLPYFIKNVTEGINVIVGKVLNK